MSTIRPDRDALLLEYRLKFELLVRHESWFSRFFPAVILASGCLLVFMLSDTGTALNDSLRQFICASNLAINPMALIYYLYVRSRFYAYATRLNDIASMLGVHGYLWDPGYHPQRDRVWLTLPLVGLAALALGLEGMWVLVLLIAA